MLISLAKLNFIQTTFNKIKIHSTTFQIYFCFSIIYAFFSEKNLFGQEDLKSLEEENILLHRYLLQVGDTSCYKQKLRQLCSKTFCYFIGCFKGDLFGKILLTIKFVLLLDSHHGILDGYFKGCGGNVFCYGCVYGRIA